MCPTFADEKQVSNTIIYNIHDATAGSSYAIGIEVATTADTGYIHNVTVFDVRSPNSTGGARGYRRNGGVMNVKNSFCGKLYAPGGSTTCYFSASVQESNVSSDATATGTNSVTNMTDYDLCFMDASRDTTDLHLRGTTNFLWGTTAADLSGDLNLPITDDIDGDARAASPDIGDDEYGGRQVYYSVGTDSTDLKVGTPNITLTDGELTFDGAQATNVGVGDAVVANAITYYISARKDNSNYMATTATGAKPANIGSTAVTSVKRAFSGAAALSGAVSGAGDGTHLTTFDLTATGADVALNLALYNDGVFDGADGAGGELTINGYTTDTTHYIRMFAAHDSSDVGVSQRHTGIEGTGVRIAPTTSTPGGFYDILGINDDYVRIEGIELDGSGITNGESLDGIHISTSLDDVFNEIRIDKVLIHDLHSSSAAEGGGYGLVRGVYIADGNIRVSNSIIYDLSSPVNDTGLDNRVEGIIATGAQGIVYIHNVSVFDLRQTGGGSGITLDANGIYKEGSGSTVTVKNAYCGQVTSVNGTATCFRGTIDTEESNVSSDATATGTNSVTNMTDYDLYFVDTSRDLTDLHLRGTTNFLWGTTGADLSGDSNLPITDDIDGDARASSPDIGADEYNGGKQVYYSVGTDSTDLKVGTPNITLTDGELTFDGAQATNVGVGDVVVANSVSYFLSARKDNSNFMATTATGAVPTNIGSTAVTSVKRAYNTIGTAISGSLDASHLNNADLTAAGADVQLNWPVYNDGAFDEKPSISGYTTDATHYIRLFAPAAASDVGTSQRHTGVEGTGARIQPTDLSGDLPPRTSPPSKLDSEPFAVHSTG